MEGGLTKMRIWVNGTFDIVHIGHIRLLEYASKFGRVRVGLDTDRRIKEKKGIKRPYNNLECRSEFMKSIKFVDSVVSFDSDDELKKRIKEWNSDYIVIGDDYTKDQVIGGELVEDIIFFNKIEGKSTSKILSYDSDGNW